MQQQCARASATPSKGTPQTHSSFGRTRDPRPPPLRAQTERSLLKGSFYHLPNWLGTSFYRGRRGGCEEFVLDVRADVYKYSMPAKSCPSTTRRPRVAHARSL